MIRVRLMHEAGGSSGLYLEGISPRITKLAGLVLATIAGEHACLMTHNGRQRMLMSTK